MPDDRNLDEFLRRMEQNLPPGGKLPADIKRLLGTEGKDVSSFSCGVLTRTVNGVTTKAYTMRIGDGPEQVFDSIDKVPREYRKALLAMTARAESSAAAAPIPRAHPAPRGLTGSDVFSADPLTSGPRRTLAPEDPFARAHRRPGGLVLYLIAGLIVVGIGAVVLALFL